MRNKIFCLLLVLSGCKPSSGTCGDPNTTLGDPVVYNATESSVAVNVAFSSVSAVLPSGWSFCQNDASSGLYCTFLVGPKARQVLPTGGSYLNATMSFDGQATCGTTQVELNVNNPSWYDVVDISLVNGYSNKVSIEVNGQKLGPPNGATGNERVFGVFPLGCDLCVSRSSATPCGMSPGSDGCKGGTQYNPDVPCQYQGTTMGGGSSIVITYEGN